MVAVHDGGHGSFAVDEDTDLALLDQHLLKTNTLTKRMTTILSKLDSRLSRLDKTIAPLGIRDMSRLQANIDAALAHLDPGSVGSVPTGNGNGYSNGNGYTGPGSGSLPPPALRQGSYGSTSGNAASVGHGSIASQHETSASSALGLGLSGAGGMSGGQLTPPVGSRGGGHANEPSTVSVMERTRAIPGRDTLPRWTDAATAASRTSLMSKSPSINNNSNQRSPALGTPGTGTAADSPQSQRSQPTVPSPLPVPSGSERVILSRGLDPMCVGEFYSATEAVVQDIEEMHRGISEGRGGSREAGISELSSLLENSISQMTDLLVKTVKDTLPRPFDPGQYASTTPTLSIYYPAHGSIRPLSVPLTDLVYPENPTPRSAQVIGQLFDKCLSEISQIRGDWLRKSFTALTGRVEEADGSHWEGRGGEKVRLCMKMWDTFVTVSECEANLSSSIMPGHAGQQLAAKTLQYPLGLLAETMGQVLQGIKRNLSAQTMTMLDLYASLVTFQPRYEGSTANWLPEAKEIQSALSAPLNALRGMALRSFPERLVDIRSPPRGGSAISSSVSDTTHNTLAYLEALPSFGNLVETLLRSSGHVERAWLMGASAPPSTAKSAASEGSLINLYAADVLGTVLQQLEAQAKTMRRPIGSTFLVNNVSHIRNTIASFKDDIIGPGAEDMLNKHFRDAKITYTAEWKSLTQTLQHTAQSRFNVGASHDKQTTKEASTAFFDRLAELEQICRQYPLNRQDPDLRDRVGRDVEDLVRVAYATFWNKAHGKGFDKYLRATTDEVARRVRAVFR